MKTNKGISLIVLVITIIVIIILVGAVMLNIVNNNIIKKASESKFKNNVDQYNSELLMSLAKEFFEDDKFNPSTFNKGIWDGGASDGTIKQYIPSITSTDGTKFEIQSGKLVYVGTDEVEESWFVDIGNGTDTLSPDISENVQTNIVAGYRHTAILMDDGTVKTWGYNTYGQLGIGSFEDRYIPVTVPGLTDVKQIASGDDFMLALLNDGTVKAWGNNEYGQLGDGTWTNRSSPKAIVGLTNVKEVVAGGYHSLALMEDGTVKAWGGNWDAQLGDGTYTDRCTPISVKSSLRNVTELIDMEVTGLWSQAFTENSIKLQFTSDSSENANGFIVTKIRYIENGETFEETLSQPIINTNYNNNQNVTYEINKPNATSISVNFALLDIEYNYDFLNILNSSNVVLKTYTGDVYTDSLSLLVDGGVLQNVKSLAAGWEHNIAILNDDTMKAWGANWDGQYGNGSDESSDIPVTIPGVTGVKQITAGYRHTIALINDGTVKVWGNNFYGQLGDGTSTYRYNPITIPDLTGVKQIYKSGEHTVVLMNDGTLKAWGYNEYGQLGYGTSYYCSVPYTVNDVAGAEQVAIGGMHTTAVMSDGTVKSWGKNSNGQLGDGTVIDRKNATSIDLFAVDVTPPEVVYDYNGGIFSSPCITVVTVRDAIGVDSSTLQYKWDTQDVITPSSGWTTLINGQQLSPPGSGTYYLWVKATDRLGHSGVYKSNQFIIVPDVIVSAVQTENKTFSGATTGFSHDNPVIPAGFVAVDTLHISWSNLDTDWNKGLVIQDASGNQFVWVPVDGTNVTYEKWCTWGYSYLSTTDDILPSGFSSSKISNTYKGFYIARYESAFDYNAGNIRATSKKSVNKSSSSWSRDSAHTGYLWNYIDYTDAKTYSENMASSYEYDISKVGTNLITSAQWDTTMKWIQNSGLSVTNSTAWGNYSAPLKISGYSEYWKSNNIYDLAGNVFEWSNEIYQTKRTIRGGDYQNQGNQHPASSRYYDDIDELSSVTGFRVVLHIL